MADQSQPIYSWRPTGSQGNNYFGAKPSFGQSLNGAVQGSGGAPSPVAPAQGGGFNVPGGNAAGFNDPGFNPGSAPGASAQPTGTPTPPPASFGDALRSNPLSKPFPTSPADAATQAALHSAVGNLQPNQGPSMSSMVSLNEYNKSESEALRQAKETAALNGRGDTGQIVGDVSNTLSQKLIPARQNFLGQLQGQEEQQNITKQQNAQQNILGLTGQAQQAGQFDKTLALNTTLGMGDLSIREKTLAQGASQFTDQLSFQKYATDKGFSQQEAQRAWQATQNQAQLASSEKVAFAGLDVQKQQLAQQAMQFNSKQEFDTWALTQNLSQSDKEMVWKASEAEKDRQLSTGQGDLNRTLQKYIADQGFNMDSKKLETQIQQFSSTQDFQKWATQAGLDADTQKLVWQANQNDIQRKQELGMQLTANEQQVRMQGLQDTSAQAMAQLNHTLNLDTLDKQQANEVSLKAMDQSFTDLMTVKGYSHDEAMAATKQDYAKELQKQGYDHDTAMQAADQWFQGKQADKQLAQTKYLAEADMAQKYDFFAKDLQQKYAFKQQDVTLAKAQLDQEAKQFAQSFGLDSKKFDLLKGTQEWTNLTDTTSTLMAMAGDNPDMLQFAAENFYKGMANLKQPDGTKNPDGSDHMAPVMDAAGVNKGLLGISAGAWKGTAADFTAAKASEKDAQGNPKYSATDIANAAGAILAPGGTGIKISSDSVDSILKNVRMGGKITPDQENKLKDSASLNVLGAASDLANLNAKDIANNDVGGFVQVGDNVVRVMPESGQYIHNTYTSGLNTEARRYNWVKVEVGGKAYKVDNRGNWFDGSAVLADDIDADIPPTIADPLKAKPATVDPAMTTSVGQYTNGMINSGIGYLSA